MTTNRRLPADRDRAITSLRQLTIGTAAGGIAATMLFGGLAGARDETGRNPIDSDSR